MLVNVRVGVLEGVEGLVCGGDNVVHHDLGVVGVQEPVLKHRDQVVHIFLIIVYSQYDSGHSYTRL